MRIPSELLLLSCITFLCVHTQEQDALDLLLAQVFAPSKGTPTSPPPASPPTTSSTSIYTSNEENVDVCKCVPYYMCKTGVIKNGFGLSDIR